MSATAVKSALAQQLTKVSQKTWRTGLCLALADTLAVALAAIFSLVLFQLWSSPWSSLLKALLPALSTLLVFAVLGLYPVIALNPALEFQRVIVGSALGYAIAAGILSLRQAATAVSLARYAVAATVTILFVFACRSLCHTLCCAFSWWRTPVVLFGSGPDARAVCRTLRRQCTGLKLVGVFDENPVHWPELEREQVHVGTPEYAAQFAHHAGVSHAIVASSALTGSQLADLIQRYAACFRHVLVLPGLPGSSRVRVETRAVGGMVGIHLTQNLLDRRAHLMKRSLDLLLAPLIALPLLPFFALICLAVRLSSRGPIFYGHVRIGRGRSTFKAWKFRTMHQNADHILSACLERDPELRHQWENNQKLKRDPRVTLIGRVLRKTSLDEIPQLWNVVTGDMSFVGPRPIVAAEVPRYGRSFEDYAQVRPGLTGLWQVSGRNNTTYQDRVEFDEYYVRNWSVWLDLYIIGRTLKTVLLAEGAY